MKQQLFVSDTSYFSTMIRIIKNAIPFLCGVAFFISCNSKSESLTPVCFDGKYPDESAQDIEIVVSDSGEVNFKIFAPVMNKYEGANSYMDFPEGIIVTSYSNGEKHSVLTADYAISEDRIQRMEASKNVVITDLQKKESIRTEQIIWDKRNKIIYSNVEVVQIKADGTTNRGDGFEADERFTKYSIRNPRGEMLANEF